MPFALPDSVHSTGRKIMKKNHSETFILKDCRNKVNNNITNNVKYIGKTQKKKTTKNYLTAKQNNFGCVYIVSAGS